MSKVVDTLFFLIEYIVEKVIWLILNYSISDRIKIKNNEYVKILYSIEFYEWFWFFIDSYKVYCLIYSNKVS